MFENLKPSHYEKILHRHSPKNGLGLVLAGAARSLRLTYSASALEKYDKLPTPAGFVGPLVLLYVAWIIRKAVAENRRRLYFLARDACILKKVADLLIHEWELDIDCRYLYCSRESLLLAAYEGDGDFERNWITWGYLSSISIGEIAERVGLKVDDLWSMAVGTPMAVYCANPYLPITLEDRGGLYSFLARDEVVAAIRESSSSCFQMTLDYLQQEGLADGKPFSVVDSGWRGSSQYALGAVLNKAGIYPQTGIAGFYLGINNDAWCYRQDVLKGFIFDWRSQRRDYRLYNFLCFEMLFASDHGRTIGYSFVDGEVVPILGAAPDGFVRRLSEMHHRTALAFAKRVLPLLTIEDLTCPESPELARLLASEFICSPSEIEAEIYGSWPMASEIREVDYQLMAPPMGPCDFFNVVMGRRRIAGFWPQASLVRGGLRSLARGYNLFLDLSLLEWYRQTFLRY